MRIKNNVIGSNTLMTTTSEYEEIIPPTPENWTVPLVFKVFSFMNTEDCHIILNGDSGLNNKENKIFLRGYQGLSLSESDVDVKSFVIVEQGITYNYIGRY